MYRSCLVNEANLTVFLIQTFELLIQDIVRQKQFDLVSFISWNHIDNLIWLVLPLEIVLAKAGELGPSTKDFNMKWFAF